MANLFSSATCVVKSSGNTFFFPHRIRRITVIQLISFEPSLPPRTAEPPSQRSPLDSTTTSSPGIPIVLREIAPTSLDTVSLKQFE